MEKIKINSRESYQVAKKLLIDNGYKSLLANFQRMNNGRNQHPDGVLCAYETVIDLAAQIEEWAKKNPKPRKSTTGTKKKPGRKKSKKSEIVKLPTDLADKNGWLAICEGVRLSGIDHQIFMAKVMQMFADEMHSAEYDEKEKAELARVNELQSKVNSLTAKIQPIKEEIAQLNKEIEDIQKQWKARDYFHSQLGEYTYILHNNSVDNAESDSEKGSQF